MKGLPRLATKRTVYTVVAGGAFAGCAWVALRPRPTSLALTARAGDDTVVVNQSRSTHLQASVLDQYDRRLKADTAVRYRWVSGDSIALATAGGM